MIQLQMIDKTKSIAQNDKIFCCIYVMGHLQKK